MFLQLIEEGVQLRAPRDDLRGILTAKEAVESIRSDVREGEAGRKDDVVDEGDEGVEAAGDNAAPS